MEVFLRFVGNPGFQSDVWEDIGIHWTTVCKTINSVLNNIIEKSSNLIHFPATNNEMNEAKLLWLRQV